MRMLVTVDIYDASPSDYDLPERFRIQLSYFPYGGRVNLVDAASRLYDISPTPPEYVDPSVPESEQPW